MTGLHYQPVWRQLPYLLGGAAETVMLTVMAFAGGLALAIAIAIARREAANPLRKAAAGYVIFFTNTPQLSQIFAIFYCLPLLGLTFSPFLSVLLGMTLNAGAYMADIVGTEIASTPVLYHEAAATLGLGWRHTYRYIILPRALTRATRGLENHFLLMLLGSSMASIFGVEELTGRAYNIIALTFRSIEVISVVAVLYVVLSLVAAVVFARLWRLA